MTLSRKTYIIVLIIDILLLSLGILRQDIFFNNYSYYATSLNGYLFLLLMAILSSILMYNATFKISNKRYAYIAFMSFITSSIIPNSMDQSTLLASIHVIFAYLGFCLSLLFNIVNLKYFSYFNSNKYKYFSIFSMLVIFSSLYFYLEHFMINFISEYIYMIGTLIQNSLMFLIKEI